MGLFLSVSPLGENHDHLQNEDSVARRLLESSSLGLKNSFAAAGGNSHVLLKKPAQLQPFVKSFDQPHSAELRKLRLLEKETEFPGPSTCPAQRALLGAFVPRSF